MKPITTFAVCLFLSVAAFSTNREDISEKCFLNPETEYGPMTWWHWINGNVTRNGILSDLIAMHNVGIRGVQMFNTHMYMPKGPVKFGSEEWFDLVKYAIEVCDSLGMKFTCMTGAGWSGSGGPWITPELAMKKLVWSETSAEGGHIDIILNRPDIVKDYYHDELLLAIPADSATNNISDLDAKIMMANKEMLVTPENLAEKESVSKDSIIDLTSFLKEDGHIVADLPEGVWTLLRFGYTITGKMSHPAAWGGEGYEVDKFSGEAVGFQYDNLIGRLCNLVDKYVGNTFEGILFDSYEANWQNWADGMFDKFMSLNGYDLRPYMPAFTGRLVESSAETERVLYDFRLLCDHLLTECFYGTMQKKAHESGMKVYAEAQGGPVPACAMDKVDIPMNEFWTPDTRPRLTKIKLTSTQADLRERSIVAAEAFTSKPENGKWQNTPRTMKRPGDLAFAGGINRFCFHTYAMQPLDYIAPGFGLGRYGLIFSRLTTWWNYSSEWIKYITRSQYVLQHGRNVADVGFLFHDDIRYNFPSSMVKLPEGYDYLVIYPEQLIGAYYKDGRIILPSGLSVSILVLPSNARMDMQSLETLYSLVKSGAPLLTTGDTPLSPASLKEYLNYDSVRYEQIMVDLFGGGNNIASTRNVGKGVVYSGQTISKAIANAAITPDIVFNTTSSDKLFYLHRAESGIDYYYITNQTLDTYDMKVDFRVANRKPEIWDPVTGTISNAIILESGQKYTSIKLHLKPEESLFVMFREPLDNRVVPNCECREIIVNTMPLNGPWNVCFLDKRQIKEDSIEFISTSSWAENSDERIKYYSGTAVYSKTIQIKSKDLDSATKIVLDLGELNDIAKIRINGNDIGILWTPPFKKEITPFVRKGKNLIEIDITNTWINRIIGDEKYPDDVKYKMEGSKFTIGCLAEYPSWLYDGSQPEWRKRITFYTWKHYDASSPLVESGLLGPSRIEFIR